MKSKGQNEEEKKTILEKDMIKIRGSIGKKMKGIKNSGAVKEITQDHIKKYTAKKGKKDKSPAPKTQKNKDDIVGI